jgi:hypothetical protein
VSKDIVELGNPISAKQSKVDRALFVSYVGAQAEHTLAFTLAFIAAPRLSRTEHWGWQSSDFLEGELRGFLISL